MNLIVFLIKRCLKFFINLFSILWDARLKTLISVKESGSVVYKIFDFGKITRMRARTFETKEPDTIKWIKSFDKGDSFLDVGANIGIYSLFAATKGIDVVAIEPDSLNNALLNLNIRINKLGEKISSYSIALHDSNKFSKFNIASQEWGGALNSFDNTLNQVGKNYVPKHYQFSYGISIDNFLTEISFYPNHLKIDVDGNEFLILKGSKKFLKEKCLKSILIELDESRKDYSDSVQIIRDAGFKFLKKTSTEILKKNSKFLTYNYIFVRDII